MNTLYRIYFLFILFGTLPDPQNDCWSYLPPLQLHRLIRCLILPIESNSLRDEGGLRAPWFVYRAQLKQKKLPISHLQYCEVNISGFCLIFHAKKI